VPAGDAYTDEVGPLRAQDRERPGLRVEQQRRAGLALDGAAFLAGETGAGDVDTDEDIASIGARLGAQLAHAGEVAGEQ
jgi:hypothetical protein